MKSEDVVKLLRAKHAEDVFLSECKDGPTQCSTHSRLDGWAMQKSWTRPTTYGYEVKVSRNDFLRDDKWQNYLDLCSDFYFVCPWGLIQPEEIAHPAGLLWVAKTGTRLWEKKKAARREVQIPETLWRYVVMRLDTGVPYKTSREQWREWLDAKSEDIKYGHRCGRRLREVISQKVDMAQYENRRLQKELEKLQELKAAADRLGISLHGWDMERELKAKEARRAEIFTEDEIFNLKGAHKQLGNLIQKIEKK